MKYKWTLTCETKTLLKELKKYEKSLETGVRNIIRQFANKVVKEARNAYGESAVTVTADPVQQSEATCYTTIRANGRPVVFLEFGAGDYTDPSHEYAASLAAAGVYVRAGEWSRTEGNGANGKHPTYADDGWWWYDGKVYKGVMPRRVLFNAVQAAMTTAEKDAVGAYGKKVK